MILEKLIKGVSANEEDLVRLAVPHGARDMVRVLAEKRCEKLWQTCVVAISQMFKKEGYSERDLLILLGIASGDLDPELDEKCRSYNKRYNKIGTRNLTTWKKEGVPVEKYVR